MLKKNEWYEPFESLNLPAGTYQIWIFAGDRRGRGYSAGKSACAWEIRDAQGALIDAPDALVTDHDRSIEWRGYIAACTRGVEKLPNQSTAVICSHHGGFLRHIEAIDDYRANGWRTKAGGKLSGVDIWERFILARDGTPDAPRGITVETKDVPSDHEIIERLRKKVNAALDAATGKKRKGK